MKDKAYYAKDRQYRGRPGEPGWAAMPYPREMPGKIEGTENRPGGRWNGTWKISGDHEEERYVKLLAAPKEPQQTTLVDIKERSRRPTMYRGTPAGTDAVWELRRDQLRELTLQELTEARSGFLGPGRKGR